MYKPLNVQAQFLNKTKISNYLRIREVSSARSIYISHGLNASGPISSANKTIIHESLNSVFVYDYVNIASG